MEGIFTSDYHHADCEDLLVVSFGCDVAETHGGHAGHCEVKGGYVHGAPRRAGKQLRYSAGVCVYEAVWRLRDVGELPQPRVLDPRVGVVPPNRVPEGEQ